MVAEVRGAGKGARKCPFRQISRRMGVELVGLPAREDRGWGRRFAAPRKKICGPVRDPGFDRADFLAPTHNLTVILRARVFCGVC